MGWGYCYEVDGSARDAFAEARSKSDWYDVLQSLDIESKPALNCEDSIRAWGAAFQDEPAPLSRMFVGDMHAEYDEYDDPNVCYLGPPLVQEVARELQKKGKAHVASLLHAVRPAGNDQWLFEPLSSFLSSA